MSGLPEPAGDRLLGAWQLVSYLEINDQGEVAHPVGTTPTASILYTADGRMSAQIMREDAGPGEENLADAYYVGYSGRATVDEEAQIVTHHIEVSAIFSWMGTAQRRLIEFNADGTLTLSSVEPVQTASGTNIAQLTWARYQD